MASKVPVNPNPITDKEIDAFPIITLAFVGDSVQTLYERTAVCYAGCAKPNVLHKMVSKKVSAVAQADAMKNLLDCLNEREMDIYKRARNVSPHTLPKHVDQNVYRVATGFEAVIGYLYLTGEADRLEEILSLAYKEKETI